MNIIIKKIGELGVGEGLAQGPPNPHGPLCIAGFAEAVVTPVATAGKMYFNAFYDI